jgi:hypothetical protein
VLDYVRRHAVRPVLVPRAAVGQNGTVIDFTDPASAHQRLSHAERDDAVAALMQFAAEGRLTTAEASGRAETARTAVKRGDLAPLFSDLPRPAQPETAQPYQAHAGSGTSYDPDARAYGASGHGPSVRARRTWRYAIVSIMPFVALALFFITGNVWGFSYAWLWFLLIPIAGIFTYGVGGWGEHDRDR